MFFIDYEKSFLVTIFSVYYLIKMESTEIEETDDEETVISGDALTVDEKLSREPFVR